ncbi:OsmC family protein [Candidatus Fermentibacteria bacterium]|nr:OsmC family protein [Candidatus Fermentibacteria bacterium]
MDLTITFPGNSRVNAEFNGFTVATDQAVDGGGEGSAPEPFDLFLASLGTCAGIYALSFLQNRGIPTDALRMTLSTERDPSRRMLKKIIFHVVVPECFPQKYVPALIRSIDHCTVKRHLHEPPEFETIVAIGDSVDKASRSPTA